MITLFPNNSLEEKLQKTNIRYFWCTNTFGRAVIEICIHEI